MKQDEQQISVNEIIPGLWLGNETAATNYEFIASCNISNIVNATKHIPCKWVKSLNIDYYRIPVNDPGPNVNIDNEDNICMLNNLPQVTKYINDNLKNKKNILVHCHAGIQRSATVILVYLIEYVYTVGEMDARLKFSLRHLLNCRPIAFYEGSCCNFKPAIINYLINLYSKSFNNNNN